MGVKVTVRGRRKLHVAARIADLEIEAGSAEAVEESAKAIRDGARGGAPVDRGVLVEEIDADVDGLNATVGVFGESAQYAPYVEFGTSTHEAHHFMAAAAEAERRHLAGRVERNVEARLP